MRISDWSSDVCSSDLYVLPGQARASIIPPVDRRRVHQERGHPFDHRTSFPSNQDISRIKQMAGHSRAGATWNEREGKGDTPRSFMEIGAAANEKASLKYRGDENYAATVRPGNRYQTPDAKERPCPQDHATHMCTDKTKHDRE